MDKTSKACAGTLKSAIRKARKSGPGAKIIRYRQNEILEVFVIND